VCLPKESRNLLNEDGIFIPTPTPKLPLFNYISFIKVLLFHEIQCVIEGALKIQRINTSNNTYFILQELLKAFMNQISSPKILDYDSKFSTIQNIPFATFSGAKDCLTDLLEFKCNSLVYPEHVHRLSQTCRNIRSFSITLESKVSNGLKRLISSQDPLKSLGLTIGLTVSHNFLRDITPLLTKHHNTLTRLHIFNSDKDTMLSFVASFINLQELVIASTCSAYNGLQHIILPNLQIFKILYTFDSSDSEIFIKFLENNGRNLTDLCIFNYMNKSLNLTIIQHCLNLKSLYIFIEKNGSDTLKSIFDSCRHLERIDIWCGRDYLDKDFIDEKEMFNIIATSSPKNLNRLKIIGKEESKLLSKELESFFLSWGKRIPKKQLILIITETYGLDSNEENIKIIEKYKKLGIIKEFKIESQFSTKYLFKDYNRQ